MPSATTQGRTASVPPYVIDRGRVRIKIRTVVACATTVDWPPWCALAHTLRNRQQLNRETSIPYGPTLDLRINPTSWINRPLAHINCGFHVGAVGCASKCAPPWPEQPSLIRHHGARFDARPAKLTITFARETRLLAAFWVSLSLVLTQHRCRKRFCLRWRWFDCAG